MEQYNQQDEQVPESNLHISDTSEKSDWKKDLLSYLHDMVFLIAGILLAFLLIFRIVVVSGDSMHDTLVDGDYLLLLSNVFYRTPKQGDIVVIAKTGYDNDAAIVKRIIATEGQTVDIDFEQGIVYVDNQPLDEPYVYSPTTIQEGVSFPLTVDKGCIFVLGDNRRVSKDSRNPEIGQIDTREILGKVIFLIFPGSHSGDIPRNFNRIGGIS